MVQTFQDRYSRQVLFPGIGAEGQKKLSVSRVGIVGCGATGSVLASLLARSGVGALRIIDRDFVESSNLQRQSLFDENDARESFPKAIAAARQVARFNSEIVVEPRVTDLVPENIRDLLDDMQLVLDGTDNFETRYLINDYCVSKGVPWVYSAAVGSYGTTLNILPGVTACLACIFPEPPSGIVETCDTSGILNSVVNLVASIAATEALKILVGHRSSLRRTMVSWDLWNNQRAELSADRSRSDCRVCGRRDFIHLSRHGASQVVLCGRNAVQFRERHALSDFPLLASRLLDHGVVHHNQYVLRFCREPYEMTLFTDGRVIVRGTSDPAIARGLYARYIGN